MAPKILILGDGRIARAIRYYLKKSFPPARVSFLKNENEVKQSDLLIGVLPGDLAQKCLDLALKYSKNLIDVSDVDPPDYLKRNKEIREKGILVIPGCGFSPGLVNLILGRELERLKGVSEIEIKAGTISPRENFYPFLWCFEDIVLGHRLNSIQVLGARKKELKPFYGYKKEKFFGIEAESYFSASGLDNLLDALRLKNFTYRVIRPHGFMHFFNFLEAQGLLSKDNLLTTKNLLEQEKEDNITLAKINFIAKNKCSSWILKSFSRKNEEFSSMQKITSGLPAVVAKLVLANKIKNKGLVFTEELGKDAKLFKNIIQEVKICCGIRILTQK